MISAKKSQTSKIVRNFSKFYAKLVEFSINMNMHIVERRTNKHTFQGPSGLFNILSVAKYQKK